MNLIVTVVITETGARADVAISAPDDTPARVLLDRLCTAVGAPAATAMSVDGRPIAVDGTAADCGLRPGAIVEVGASSTNDRRSDVVLAVTTGPDVGLRLALTSRDQIVGRDPSCALMLTDDIVSRHHLAVTTIGSAVYMTDLRSANGTWVDGARLSPGKPVELTANMTVRVGHTELRLIATPTTARPPSQDGLRAVRRAPHLAGSPRDVDVTFPAPPAPPTPTRLPVLAAVAPLVAGVVLALVLHQWQLLAFTALSPVMVVGQAASDRRTSRRVGRAAMRDYLAATDDARATLATALADEQVRRHRAAPDLAALVGALDNLGALLWQERAGPTSGINLRLGCGDVPSDIRVVGASAATAAGVPVVVSMASVDLLGMCGKRRELLESLRALVIQAATRYGPTDVQITILAPGRAAEWAWTRWLPHVVSPIASAPAAGLGLDEAQVTARLDDLSHATTTTLVVVDGPLSARAETVLTTLATTMPMITAVWAGPTEPDLPAAVRAIVEVASGAPTVASLRRSGHDDTVAITPDRLSAAAAERIARSLAALRDDSRDGQSPLPPTVRWVELARLDLSSRATAAQALLRRWSLPASTTIELGQGGDGPLTIDLRRDGPHVLVAGTTGSGKSELLLTIVAGLVAGNRPDRLNLLLIDHKGGAAFGRCGRLPHTAGVVTDLDPTSTKRALMSLGTELRRREQLLAAAGAADLDAYLAQRPATPLGRLVIIIDEFAALAEEQPDFIGGLVAIAARGRSLGIHLILATQRPDGVVSSDIRANTRLRICLGVTREAESRDVIDSPAATAISPTTPGRAFVRIGAGELREVQTARVATGRSTRAAVNVTLCPAETIGSAPPPMPADPLDESDLDVLVDAAIAAANELGPADQMSTPLWLPPLPEHLPMSTLPTAPDDAATWGLVDLPIAGRHDPLLVELDSGATTVIVGAARSGRSSAAAALATAVAGRLSPDELTIWAIDAGSGLAALSALPHCGATIPVHDIDRIERLLGYLAETVDARRRSPDPQSPALLLIVDSWESVTSAGDDRHTGRLTDVLLRLATDGPAARLHLVITADRGGLAGRLAATATERIVLRLADPSDFTIIGVTGRDVPRALPPGRGIRASDLALVQIALPDATALARTARWSPPRRPPRRFEPLPERLMLDELGQVPAQIAVGIGEDRDAIAVSPESLTPFLVAGHPGSGRTTALVTIARQLGGRRIAVSCSARSPLLAIPGTVHLPRDDHDHAAALLDALLDSTEPAPHIVIDDLDLLPESPMWPRLDDRLGARSSDDLDAGPAIVVASGIEALAAAFRGPLATARRSRSGLLLQPRGPHDGEVLGVRLARSSTRDEPPGRGYLIHRGSAIRLQVAVTGIAATTAEAPAESRPAPR